MHVTILNDILIIFGLSIVVVYVFSKFKIPTIVGFLLTGILAGPYGLRLVTKGENVESLAEIGVILILFSIGIEFSISKLIQIKKNLLVGGSVQVFLTIGLSFAILYALDLPVNTAIFAGFIIALSSTAIALKLFQSKAMTASPPGKLSLSILIYQDLIVIPMILFVPLLAGKGGDLGKELLELLLRVIAIAILLIVSIKWIMPRLMYKIAKTRIRELFLLSTIVICLVIIWISSFAGISAALGAFLAGLIISETDYSHEALGFVEPFREVFSSFFFVSIGMMLNIVFFWQNAGWIILISLIMVSIKVFSVIAATFALKYPLRVGIYSGLALLAIGEFSFVLSKTGLDYGLISGEMYQYFLSAAVLSMMAAPLIFELAPYLSDKISKALAKKNLKPEQGFNNEEPKLQNHLIIIGYGLNGRNLAKAAKYAGLPYIIIEMNPVTVRNESAAGEPIFYGDASKEAVIHNACLNTARIAVVAISDPTATRAITYNIKKHNREIYLIVRTRFLQDVEDLYALGADEVVPEEYETSVEIFTRVLSKYLIPKDEIETFIAEIRSHGYNMLRSIAHRPGISDLRRHIPDYEIVSIRLFDGCYAAGKTLAELALREKHKVTLLAIRRDEDVIPNPSGKSALLTGDIIILFGTPEKLSQAAKLFEK